MSPAEMLQKGISDVCVDTSMYIKRENFTMEFFRYDCSLSTKPEPLPNNVHVILTERRRGGSAAAQAGRSGRRSPGEPGQPGSRPSETGSGGTCQAGGGTPLFRVVGEQRG